MNDELMQLMENHKTLYQEIKKKELELHTLRKLINSKLEDDKFGFLLIPYFHTWKDHSR